MLSDPSPSKPRAPQARQARRRGALPALLVRGSAARRRRLAIGTRARPHDGALRRSADAGTGHRAWAGDRLDHARRFSRAALAPERLFLIEFDPNFCKLLKERFPGVNVIEGDAYAFRRLIEARTSEPAAAVVSSLPLLVKPETQRLDLLADAFACMRPEGVFIQFTYGPASPMPRFKPFGPTFRAERSPQVWLNIPPASVWVYQAALAHSPPQAAARSNPAQALFERLRRGTEKIQIGLKREIDGAKAPFRAKAASRPEGAHGSVRRRASRRP